MSSSDIPIAKIVLALKRDLWILATLIVVGALLGFGASIMMRPQYGYVGILRLGQVFDTRIYGGGEAELGSALAYPPTDEIRAYLDTHFPKNSRGDPYVRRFRVLTDRRTITTIELTFYGAEAAKTKAALEKVPAMLEAEFGRNLHDFVGRYEARLSELNSELGHIAKMLPVLDELKTPTIAKELVRGNLILRRDNLWENRTYLSALVAAQKELAPRLKALEPIGDGPVFPNSFWMTLVSMISAFVLGLLVVFVRMLIAEARS